MNVTPSMTPHTTRQSKITALYVVIINSNWCGYDFETKLARMHERVGIFDIKGFMTAINASNYWEYMNEDERERLKRSQTS